MSIQTSVTPVATRIAAAPRGLTASCPPPRFPADLPSGPAGHEPAAARTPAVWVAPPPVEAYPLHAPDAVTLAATASRVAELAPSLSGAELHDLACQLGRAACPPGGARLAIAAEGQAQLAERAREAARLVTSLRPGELATRPGIFAGSGVRGRVALLFPGLAVGQDPAGEPGPPLFGLTDPQAVQPAILHASLSGLRWLDRLGVTAVAALGHSMGEITALVWAGCLAESEATRLVAQRSAVISASGARQTAMVSVAADAATAAALGAGTGVVIAAYNAPGWHVLAGPVPAVRDVIRRAGQRGIRAVVLDVSHAFHSPALARCVAPLRSVLADIRLGPPRRRVVSTVTGREVTAADDVRGLLCAALTAPVRFAEALSAVTGDADLLCETGPGHGLAALAASGCSVPAVSLEARTADDRGPAHTAAALFAAGAVDSLAPMLAGRAAQAVDIWQERIAIPGHDGAPDSKGDKSSFAERTTVEAAADGLDEPGCKTTSERDTASVPDSASSETAGAQDATARASASAPEGAGAPDVTARESSGARDRAVDEAASAADGSAHVGAGARDSGADATGGVPGGAEVIAIGGGAGWPGRAGGAAGTGEPVRLGLRGRFLQDIALHRPGAELVADSRLGPDSDPYLADYQVDGHAALPPVMALEAMAQAAAALAGRPMRSAAQVSFGAPVAAGADTRIRVCAKRDGKRITAVLRIRADGQWTDHGAATFRLRADGPAGNPATAAARTADGLVNGKATSWRTAEPTTPILDSTDLYGPVCSQTGRFRRVAFLPELTSRRCRALVRGEDEQPWFGVEPGPADTSLQLGSPGLNDATLHVLQACFPGRRVLPEGCDAVTASGRQVRGAVQVMAVQRPVSRTAAPHPEGAAAAGIGTRPARAGQPAPSGPPAPREYVWDVTAVDSDGQPVISWTGLRLRDTGPLPGCLALPPALLGVFLERGATALGLDPSLRVNVWCEPPPLGPVAAGSGWPPAEASPPRRPGWVSARSSGQLDELSLRLRAASPAACAWQTADAGQDGADPERDSADPERDGAELEVATLRRRLRDSLAEPAPTVHARIRTAIECLSKAGRPVGSKLVVDGCFAGGWALLRAGDALIACTSVRVAGVPDPVAVSIMTGTVLTGAVLTSTGARHTAGAA